MAPLALFAFSLLLRILFFQGFVLGDDVEEFTLVRRIATSGPSFEGHLQYRFVLWMFNVPALRWMGMSETGLFLPTWLFSASLAPIGFAVLRAAGYRRRYAFFAGLFVATAPFEVLLGTLRANDLFLGFFLALALLALVRLEDRPGWQGLALALLFWLGFYTKLWVVYALPALGLWYLARALRGRGWLGAASFVGGSAVLHAGTALFWHWQVGLFLPFLSRLSATNPVDPRHLVSLLAKYPRMLFVGSEHGTTLFGWIPYLLFTLLLVKAVATALPRGRRPGLRLDRLDVILLVHAVSFFLFLNFFPNHFHFDQYYSAPRIFRYLAPVSFPMALLAGKLLIDVSSAWRGASHRPAMTAGALGLALVVNLLGAAEAVLPGRIQRVALLSVVNDVRGTCPPRLVGRGWQLWFLEEVYLRNTCAGASVLPALNVATSREHERWLREQQEGLPSGALLLTGIGEYVHYGCSICGFHLGRFERPLDARWQLFREYRALDYLPEPEPVRLWRWTGEEPAGPEAGEAASEAAQEERDPETLYTLAQDLFEAHRYRRARALFRACREAAPAGPRAEDAAYFTAITYWREGEMRAATDAFVRLLAEHPSGRWSAGAHYHLGLGYERLRQFDRARHHLRIVVDRGGPEHLVHLAEAALAKLGPPPLEAAAAWFDGAVLRRTARWGLGGR